MEAFVGSLYLDLRHALRQLRRSPGFTLTAVLTLALGIGATTAIFSIVEGVLLRPLPFPDQVRLVTLGDLLEGVHYDGDAPGVTAPGVRTYIRDTHAFSSLGGYQASTYELSGLGDPAQIHAARLTASMFPVLGVSPLLGRVFNQQQDEGSQPVVVLSYQTWRGRFDGDANILGRKILLDRKPYEVIAVMPREFEFPLVPGQLNRSELWVPMSFTQAELIQGAGAWAYYMVGRLKPGVSPAQAQQDSTVAAQEIMRSFPPALSSRRIHPLVQPLDESTVAQARPLVRALFLAVTVVLFIACANLAGLLLVRVIRRRREISVRLALGASAAAVLRQSLVEALLLSFSGGLLGLALASIALRAGVSFLPETLPRVGSIGLDWQVVAFALGLAVFTGLLCGLIPAVAAARTGVNEALKEGGRTGTAGGGHARLRSALVVAELAVALVMLTASGLLLRSFQKMRSVDLGFHADHTLTAAYSLPQQKYSNQAAIDIFNLTVRTRLEQLPGVQAMGVTSMLPAADVEFLGTFTPEGYIARKGAGLNLAWIPQVMGNYFQAQGIPIIRGRDFTPADREGAPLVVIVNRTLGALLARAGPHRQAPAPRPDGGPFTVANHRWRDRRRQTAGGRCANRRAVLHSFQPSQSRCGRVCASRHAHRHGWFHRAARPVAARTDGGLPSRRGPLHRPATSAHPGGIHGSRGRGRPGVAPLQHHAHFRIWRRRRVAGCARHLQRHHIFGCIA
jgi:predicted permease